MDTANEIYVYAPVHLTLLKLLLWILLPKYMYHSGADKDIVKVVTSQCRFTYTNFTFLARFDLVNSNMLNRRCYGDEEN